MRKTGNRVHLAGGELQLDKCGAFGSKTQGFIERCFFDMAILGADAFDPDHGFLLHDPDEAAVAMTVIGRSRRTVFAVDRTKFSVAAPMVAGGPESIELVVTDGELPGPAAPALARWEADVTIAPVSMRDPIGDGGPGGRGMSEELAPAIFP